MATVKLLQQSLQMLQLKFHLPEYLRIIVEPKKMVLQIIPRYQQVLL